MIGDDADIRLSHVELSDAQDAQTLDSTPPVDAIDEAVGTEARIMLKSIRLPDADPIPNDLQRQVCAVVLTHMKKYRLTYVQVAPQVGLKSDSVLSEVIRDKYRADASPLIRKLNAWVDDDERRRRRHEPIGTYETGVLLAIRDAASIAKKNARLSTSNTAQDEGARIVMAMGPSGVGKTVAANALAAYDPNSIFVRVRQRRGTDLGLVSAIIDSAGWHGKTGRDSIIDFLFERLTGTGRLLIIDEAHRLAPSGYELLRDLADVCGIPILMIGTSKMQRRVDGPRMGVTNAMDDQFARRVAYVVDLLRGSDGQGGKKRPFFSIEEIVAIFKSDKVRLTEDGAEYLQAVACYIGCGMLGQASNIFEKAMYAALRGGKAIDSRLLRMAAEKVLMPAGVRNDEILRQIDAQFDRNRELSARANRAAVAG